MKTTVQMIGSSANIQIGAGQVAGSAHLTSATGNYTAGTKAVVVTTGTPPSVGNLAYFTQCDTGTSWNGSACVGPAVDNGGLFVCGFDSACQTSSGTTPHYESQQQQVLVTSVTNNGNGTYTIGFAPGLYMTNWSTSQAATLTWYSTTYTAIGMGLEDMTIVFQPLASQTVSINGAYDSWIKGVRLIGASINSSIALGPSKNCLLFNNYIFGQNSTTANAIKLEIDQGQDSDDLILNNILTGGVAIEGEGMDSGNVFAYNYNRDVQTSYYQTPDFQHHAEASFLLHEANQFGISQDDDTWGTHHFNTWFRNYLSCWDPPYSTINPRALEIDNYARFENVIGNALGGPKCTAGYQGTSASLGYIYVVPVSDSVALNSLMRWGNCDTVTGSCQFDSSEVPSSLSGNAAPFANSVPSSQNLPASLFINGVAAHPNGGTGLSWWKVCASWGAFPTSCATSQTQPFPPIGPDVTGGPYVNGTAYDIPAAVAFKQLPIDGSLQNSYNITSSSWSGGTETLTVSGLPNTLHLMGGFQITGAPTACDPTGGELFMTASSSTTVSYALASNPNASCTGTMKFPDVRQFDERVYQDDSASTVPAPTGLTAVVQ